jgi:hypothetical protein
MGIIWSLGLFYVIGIAFVAVQCRPVNYVWHKWDGEHSGTCLDIWTMGYIFGASIISLDLVILFLPIHPVYHLHINRRKKLQVLGES